MNRAFYTGLMGALAVLISSFIFFFTIPESGEDSFLFVRLFLISFISGAFMLFSLFINPLQKVQKVQKVQKLQKRRNLGGILLLAFSLLSLWAFWWPLMVLGSILPMVLKNPQIWFGMNLVVVGAIPGMVSSVMILRDNRDKGETDVEKAF